MSVTSVHTNTIATSDNHPFLPNATFSEISNAVNSTIDEYYFNSEMRLHLELNIDRIAHDGGWNAIATSNQEKILEFMKLDGIRVANAQEGGSRFYNIGNNPLSVKFAGHDILDKYGNQTSWDESDETLTINIGQEDEMEVYLDFSFGASSENYIIFSIYAPTEYWIDR